jgi:hypothetical protein
MWFTLSAEGLSTWRITTPIKEEASEVPNCSSNNSKSEISHFSSKPKMSEYKPFKNDKEWRAWDRHMPIVAVSHGCNNVLDYKKPPINPGENQVYDLQNKFMFATFPDNLLTFKR